MASHNLLPLIIFLTWLSFCTGVSPVKPDGLALFFTTSDDTFQDIPVKFSHPIPDWVRGTYIKNGLGKFEVGHRTFRHIFDAYAKMHSWKFLENSTVLFTAKFVKTNSYKESIKRKDIAPFLLFESCKPPFSELEKVEALLRGIDNTNVNIFEFGKSPGRTEMVAISDFWQSYQFNFSTLETVGRINAAVPGGGFLEDSGLPLQSASHPMIEYGTSNVINFVSSFNPMPFFSSTIRLVRIRSLLDRESIAEISVDQVPYMHSFGLSKRYAVLFGHPMYTNLMKMLITKEPVSSLEWHPKKPLILYVINIHTGQVRELKTEATFMMHHINSYEVRGKKIIVDAITYPDIEFIRSLKLKSLIDPDRRHTVSANPTLKRFILDLPTSQVYVKHFPLTPGVESAALLDFPVINENYRYKKYCFVYGVVLKADGNDLNTVTLVKRNLCHVGKDKMWRERGHLPTEPWFLERPNATKEDDGFLLSIVLDSDRRQSYLAIINARTMKTENSGYVPTTIPFSLHGRFFPSEVHNREVLSV